MCSRPDASSTFHCNTQRLQCCISRPNKRAGWILFFHLNGIHNRFVNRNLIVAFWQCHQHAFGCCPGDIGQRRVANAFWPHKANVQSSLFGLTQNLPHFRVITPEVDKIHIHFFQSCNQCGEIFITCGYTFKQHGIDTRFFQLIAHRTRQAFSVLLFIMNNSQTLWFDFISNELSRRWPLIGIQSCGTQDHLIATRCQISIG